MRQNFPDFATVLKEAEAGGDSDEQTQRPHIGLASAVFSAGFSPIASSDPLLKQPFLLSTQMKSMMKRRM